MNYFASDETKKLALDCGIELEVRCDISKRVFNKLVSSLPTEIDSDKGLSINQASDFSAGLFQAFVVSWNLDRPMTVDNYYELKREIAEEIDQAVGAHFSSLTPSEKEGRKSKRDS